MYKARQCFFMIHRLWTVFSQVCSSDFRNPHGQFCVGLIVMLNSQGMRQPDKVYLAILAFRIFVSFKPFFCLLITCLWLLFLIQYLELSFSTWSWIRVEREMGVEWEKIERYCEWVSVWMCVCVRDHFLILIVMRCRMQVINADMFIT